MSAEGNKKHRRVGERTTIASREKDREAISGEGGGERQGRIQEFFMGEGGDIKKKIQEYNNIFIF